MKITVAVIPKSSKTEIVAQKGSVYKIKLKSAPDKGKANDELIRFLAKHFHTPQTTVSILRGKKSRKKLINIQMDSVNS